jgi:glycerol-3-phosphate acyltransferase PlsY
VAVLVFISTALIAYLLGSIPTGFMVAKARGIDIRVVGSGNIGATNVFRILGKPAGVFVLFVDALKGWVAVFVIAGLGADLIHAPAGSLNHDWLAICAGLGAVLGHNYTCWLNFKGGKGIATSAGVLLALVPVPLLIIFAVWIVVFLLTRYVSLASIAASITLPFASWATGKSVALIAVTGSMGVLAVYKHKANIRRLLDGTESRIGSKKLPPSEAPKTTP